MHRGTLDGRCECMTRNEKISENDCERNFKDDFPNNCLGEWSNSSSRRLTHDCSEKGSSNSPRRIVQYIYRNSVVCFQEPKAFVLKMMFFSHLA